MKKRKFYSLLLAAAVAAQMLFPHQVFAGEIYGGEQTQIIENDEAQDANTETTDSEEEITTQPEEGAADEGQNTDAEGVLDEPKITEDNSGNEVEGNGENNDNTAETADGDEQELPQPVVSDAGNLEVSYQAHVQDYGWQDEVKNGMTAGTTGQAKQLEALKVSLVKENDEEAGGAGSVIVQAHVRDYGWQDEVTDGEIAGTTGENKPIEAMRLHLEGEAAEKYDIYYRVHSAGYGWLGWAKNGEIAGTYGYACPAEAVEIKLYLKDAQDKPQQTEKSYLSEDNMGNVIYQTHVQDYGWQDKVTDGATGGTTYKGKNLEALRIKISEMGREYGGLSGSVVYQAHVQAHGWMDEVKDDQIAGTVGENKPIEALRIKLEGQLAEVYDIYYRVHSAGYGWFGWAKNGEIAGTYGYACPAEAVEIKLYLKDAQDKPQQTGKSYLSDDNLGNLVYQAHIEETGWQKKVADGATAGTTGENRHIEAVSMNISELGLSNGIEGSVVYQAHVATIGWQDEVKDGEIAGTVGEAKAMEAIRIHLEGPAADTYDIYYRVHITNFGWLGWAKNGETAGSTNYACGIEAVEIKLIAKNSEEAPEAGNRAYLSPDFIGEVQYNAFVEGSDWQGEVKNGETAGMTGSDKSIQAIKISVPTGEDFYYGGIEYSLHLGEIGWLDWEENGGVAGVTDGSTQAEAIKVRLTGELADYADVYYRTHVSWYGWLDWAKNGEPAGTTKCAYKLQAIEIKIVPKYTPAPGSTSRPYMETKYRVYQNPSQYYQISNSITLTGGGYNLSYGFEGVKVMQVIRRLGLGTGIGMGGAFYGTNVQNAVANFQRANGLSPTGVVDLLTWLRLGFNQLEWEVWGAYVSPMKVNEMSSRADHIEAMISTAYSYMGTPYVIGASGPPGTGVDCSGLVMQALYSAGLDISPINPVRHAHPGYEYESRNMWASPQFLHVDYSQRQRGDLIFYQNSGGVVIHVAIYLGNDMVIESWPNEVYVWPIQNAQRSNIKGVVRPFV